MFAMRLRRLCKFQSFYDTHNVTHKKTIYTVYRIMTSEPLGD